MTHVSHGAARARYNGVAMALHWIIALLILANLELGYWFAWLEDTAGDPSALNPQGFEVLMRHWIGDDRAKRVHLNSLARQFQPRPAQHSAGVDPMRGFGEWP